MRLIIQMGYNIKLFSIPDCISKHYRFYMFILFTVTKGLIDVPEHDRIPIRYSK